MNSRRYFRNPAFQKKTSTPPISNRRTSSRFSRRLAADKQEVSPGDPSATLKRRMKNDDLVELFSNSGKDLYAKVVESLKSVLRDQFNISIPALDQLIREEFGKRGQEAAAEFYRPWINEMVETIVTQGMNEASGALEDVASSYAAEKSAPEGDDDDEEELLEVPVEDVEEVDEIEIPEEGEDETEGEEPPAPASEGEEVDLDQLFGASTNRTMRRSVPVRRPKRTYKKALGVDPYNNRLESSNTPSKKDLIDALRGGYRVWNSFFSSLEEDVRVELPGVSLNNLDLHSMDLWGTNFSGSEFKNSNLEGIDLEEADLSGADLSGAVLTAAILRNTNLRGAFLRNTSLQEAYLNDADLQDADLRGADLIDADLRGANLDRALLRGAIYSMVTRFPVGFSPEGENMILEDALPTQYYSLK